MKRFLSIILVLVLLISCVPIYSYAQRNVSKQEKMAQELKELGLFRGVSETNFDLERAPSRVEAVVMLVRALGKEEEALNEEARHPFTDVPAWADPYIGYAYDHNLTNGQSADLFGNSDASAAMYITFVLRALGYSDGRGDFLWDSPYTLARQTGILTNDVDIENFMRADVVSVTHNALAAYCRNSTTTLSSKLIAENVFTQEEYDAIYDSFRENTSDASKIDGLTSEEIYEKCKSSVIYIETYDEDGQPFACGSGFFIDDKGTAVTNYHVIRGAYYAFAQISESEEDIYEIVGVYDYNSADDWAVIKVDCTGNDYLNIGSTEEIVGGLTVYTIGNPQSFKNSMSQGIVSNPSRVSENTIYIQITAPVSPGSSGGALLDKYGHAIGIITKTNSGGQNLNFALPIWYIDDYDNDGLMTLAEIADWEKYSFDFWFSKECVVVEKGKTEYVLFDYWHDFDTPETLSFTVISENAEFMVADWETLEDEATPWGIKVEGISAGETCVVITNNFNKQVFILPVIVTEEAQTVNAYDFVVDWLKNYGLKKENAYMSVVGEPDEDAGLIICYTPETDVLYLARMGIYTTSSETSFAAIVCLERGNGNCTYLYTQEEYDGDGAMTLVSENIVPSEVLPYPDLEFSAFIGPDTIRGSIEILAKAQFATTLIDFKKFLKYYVGCVTAADFGFTSIYN